jgi:hypothetical protein
MDGCTPLDVALNRGYGNIADILNPDGNAKEFAIGTVYAASKEHLTLVA